MTHPIITLTTDFGPASHYVAQMKGLILQRAPEASLVDISHEVRPQAIGQAARLWHAAVPYFPVGSVHVAVVDPGVGTARRLVYACVAGRHLLAPDNGLFTYFARGTAAFEVIVLSEPEFWCAPVSSTFHGRDILAPVAAFLALGGAPQRLGGSDLLRVRLPLPEAQVSAERIVGEVVEVDTFGNLVTNIEGPWLEHHGLGPVRVACGGNSLVEVVRTYGEQAPGAMVALVGSGGYLEIAVVNGNAARELGLGEGAKVTVVKGWSE